ncbi:MAG: pyridoxal-phosphate dependent enzyme [Proteobacteria bacterium]|jgi:D-cysteine desulfhydrase|nr:pyridoxal-phosphate dependent enzyme [Pseudomonadota bacterium]
MPEHWTRNHLDVIARLGWVEEPTPLLSCDEEASRRALASLTIKRDDLTSPLVGGTKTRKLDFLLASPEWQGQKKWASVGAIGSGHLVALAAAAKELEAHLDAHMFWEPISQGVKENLAFVAGGPTTIRYYGNRISMVLRRPRLVSGGIIGGAKVVPPGASSPIGTLGLVRAGLELADQVAAGELPSPDHLYVAYGSGGTAAGLALGLALGGLRPTIHAVTATERVISTQSRLDQLIAGTEEALKAAGLLSQTVKAAPLTIDRRFLGRGYGRATKASIEACQKWAGVFPLEPIYSGKAMAALLSDTQELEGQNVLFWVTAHGGALPETNDWQQKLPRALSTRLAGGISRRQVLAGVCVLAAGATLGVRLTGYSRFPNWSGHVLSRWEAEVVAAAAEALLPNTPGEANIGPTVEEVTVNVDRYLVGMPQPMLTEIHGLFGLLEHGTPMGCSITRLTRLTPAARLEFFEKLNGGPFLIRCAVRGIRDLLMIGQYQDPRSWPATGYTGPMVSPPKTAPLGPNGRIRPKSRYDVLLAPPGAQPKGVA